MDIKLNTPVEYFDGERAGNVIGLILNPQTDKLTHLVVKTDGIEHLVPATRFWDATRTTMRLDRTVANLHDQPLLVKTDYARSTVDHAAWNTMNCHFVPAACPVRCGPIPYGEEAIMHGMAVFARDGCIGYIEEVLVDPANGHVTHFVVRDGNSAGAKEVLIGIAHVKSVEDDGIYLKSTKAQVPEFPPAHLWNS